MTTLRITKPNGSELMPLYRAACAWQKADKAYAEASRYVAYPKGANGLLDALLEAEQDLLSAIAVAAPNALGRVHFASVDVKPLPNLPRQ